ncbi:MAG: hypothetical protein KDK25_12160 [Leptospiraceae bacterium]|nr:hypothetical protein [Leptospiraceae bacterium]
MTRYAFILPALAFLACMGTEPRKETLQPPRKLTIKEAGVQFHVPADWKVEYKRGGIETEAPGQYPSMRFSHLEGPFGMHQVEGLKEQLSDSISDWGPVAEKTVNGMRGYAWEGAGYRDGLSYKISVVLLDRGKNCMIALMFTPNFRAAHSEAEAEKVIQSIKPIDLYY